MKTAVEYFNQEIKELFNMHQDGEISGKMFHMSRLVALGNAKEMEKKQIKDAYEKGKKYKKPIKDSNPIWLNSKPYK